MTLTEALAITGPLQRASKMPCHTYSIPAKHCKRGRKLAEVEGTVCSKCYAMRNNFTWPDVQASAQRHEEAMLHPLWCEAMAMVLTAYETSGFFRWYSGGDLQSVESLLKICDVSRRTPHLKHWLPTHEVGFLGEFKRAGFTYPSNLTVRLSADFINKPIPKALTRSLGVLAGEVATRGDHSCPASKQDNMCQTCRMCWDKRVRTVVYKYH